MRTEQVYQGKYSNSDGINGPLVKIISTVNCLAMLECGVSSGLAWFMITASE